MQKRTDVIRASRWLSSSRTYEASRLGDLSELAATHKPRRVRPVIPRPTWKLLQHLCSTLDVLILNLLRIVLAIVMQISCHSNGHPRSYANNNKYCHRLKVNAYGNEREVWVEGVHLYLYKIGTSSLSFTPTVVRVQQPCDGSRDDSSTAPLGGPVRKATSQHQVTAKAWKRSHR